MGRHTHSLIKLVVIDVDGCLNGGAHDPYDLDRLSLLRDYNQRSWQSAKFPPITLCSGRPAPYAQALIQVLDLHLPSLCEHGNMMTDIDESRVLMHPDLDPAITVRLHELRDLLRGRTGHAEGLHFETGKETHLTIFPGDRHTVDDMTALAGECIRGRGWRLEARRYGSCAVVTQPGMHKGVGLQWLARRLGIDTRDMAGIGDTAPDVDFLRLTGWTGAPANAAPEVRNLPVQYLAAESDIAGVAAFYGECVKHNSAAMGLRIGDCGLKN